MIKYLLFLPKSTSLTRPLMKHFLNFSPSLQELKNLIPKSAVGTLSANSSNVIHLIIDAYNVSALLSFFIVSSNLLNPALTTIYSHEPRESVLHSDKAGAVEDLSKNTFAFNARISLCYYVLSKQSYQMAFQCRKQQHSCCFLLGFGSLSLQR